MNNMRERYKNIKLTKEEVSVYNSDVEREEFMTW
jgi:hypothetical protein